MRSQQLRPEDLQSNKEVKDMQNILNYLTKTYFPLPQIKQEDYYYSRSIASVITSRGEKQLVCTVNAIGTNRVYHGEELIFRGLYEIYHADPHIVEKKNQAIKIKINTLLTDIEPCGKSKQHHQCHLFFTPKGRPYSIKEKTYTAYLSPAAHYWAIPFSDPEDLSSARRLVTHHYHQVKPLDTHFKLTETWHPLCHVLDVSRLQQNSLCFFPVSLNSLQPPTNLACNKRKAAESCTPPIFQHAFILRLRHFQRFTNQTVREKFIQACQQYEASLLDFYYDSVEMQGAILAKDQAFLTMLGGLIKWRSNLSTAFPLAINVRETCYFNMDGLTAPSFYDCYANIDDDNFKKNVFTVFLQKNRACFCCDSKESAMQLQRALHTEILTNELKKQKLNY